MLTNEQMKPGRFLRLHRGRKRLARMVACWGKGGVVYISTHLRTVKVDAKRQNAVTMDARGSLYVLRGRHRDCIDFCNIQFSR